MQQSRLLLVVVLALAVLAQAGVFKESEYTSAFSSFTKKFKKSFATAALLPKLTVFKATMDRIARHNANPKTKYQMGVTKFSDLTTEEFKKQVLGGFKPDTRSFVEMQAELEAAEEAGVYGDDKAAKAKAKADAKKKKEEEKKAAAEAKKNKNKPAVKPVTPVTPPKPVVEEWKAAESIDWLAKGVVGPVRDQGSCGSCWAFTTVGVVESHLAIKNGKFLAGSPQAMLSCDTTNSGCSGGRYGQSFAHAVKFGIFPEADFPYVGKVAACSIEGVTPIGKPTAGSWVGMSWERVHRAIGRGPVAIALNADKLQHYKSGIFGANESDCAGPHNHAVYAIGYTSAPGTNEGGEFTIRNSWGSSWGENGNFRLARGTPQSQPDDIIGCRAGSSLWHAHDLPLI